jgi:hypothetical protein
LAQLETVNGSSLYEYKDGQTEVLLSFSVLPQEVAFNPHDQHYWFMPKGSQSLEAYQIGNQQQVFTAQANTTFTEPYADLVRNGREVFYSIQGGEIRRINANLSARSFYQNQPNTRFGQVVVGENYVAAEEQNQIGNDRRLAVFFRQGGGDVGSLSVANSFQDMLDLNEQQALLLSNESADGKLYLLEYNPPSLRWVDNLSGMRGIALEKVDSRFALCLTDQGVWLFDLQLEQARSLVAVNQASDFCFDMLDQTILVAVGNEVRVYSLSNGSLVSTYSFPSKVLKVRLRYNRI